MMHGHSNLSGVSGGLSVMSGTNLNKQNIGKYHQIRKSMGGIAGQSKAQKTKTEIFDS